ncbi:MAG: delta-60 repeat domain-containing protein [Verrucomicrobiales bacterium]|nr:delta-60 repeat domain-containing protein [Verrucomicrobiales bacterium]
MKAMSRGVGYRIPGAWIGQVLAMNPETSGAVPAAGTLDASFEVTQPMTGLRGMALQQDGKALVWGIGTLSVTNGGGVTRERALLRLNSDGSIDPAFVPFRELVFSAAVQRDGKIVVGGSWGTGMERRPANIGRLNPDGSWDDSFSPGVGTDVDANPSVVTIYVTDVKVQPDDKVLVAGTFRSMAGEKRHGLARLNADGTPDAGFSPVAPAGSSFGGMILQGDGKILIGAAFASGSGTYTMRLMRLASDGSLDGSFVPSTKSGIRPGDFETMLALQKDGKILGTLLNTDAKADLKVARMNPDGTRDASFDVRVRSGTASSINLGRVAAMAVQPNGKIVVAGGFDRIQGSPRRGIARLNPDGTLDPEFGPDATLESANTVDVRGMGLLADGAILVVGNDIAKANGIARRTAVRFLGDPPLRFGPLQRAADGAWVGHLLPNGPGTVVLESSSDLKRWAPAETYEDSGGGIAFRASPSSGPGLFFRGFLR